MKKFMNTKGFYLILSLFFALLLFFNANNTGSNIQTLEQSDSNLKYQEVSTQVPVTFKYDENKYYITSDVNTATVKLASSNQVLLDMESNSQTRHFQVVADLRSYSPGTYEIPLKVTRLNRAAKASVTPTKIKVTIEKRESRTFNIQTNVTSSWVAKGHQLKNVTVSPSSVTVSAGTQSMNQIQKVVAILPKQTNVTSSFTRSVTLQAVDASGNEIPVDFNVSEVTVNVEVDSPSKEVPINLLQKGKLPSGISSYQLLCDTQTVTLQGDSDALAKVDGIDVNIDISQIKKTTTKDIKLNIPSGLKSNVDTVSVTIVPESSQTSDESDSSTTDTSESTDATTTNSE